MQTGLFDSDGEDGVAGGTLEEMMRMEQDARDALEYEEAMEAHAEAMHEVLSSSVNPLRCIICAFLSILVISYHCDASSVWGSLFVLPTGNLPNST
jgi:hypothetical protein